MKEQRAGQGELDTTTEKKKPPKKGGNGGITTAQGRKFTKDDFVELCVLCAYIVQQRGQASIHDVQKAIKIELNSRCHVSTLSKVLEALRSKDHLAALYQGSERVYKMKKLKFNTSVELAHVQRLLPTLLEDPAGMAIKAEIENKLQEGKCRTTKGRDYPAEWATYKVRFKLLECWHGGHVWDGNAVLQAMYENSAFNATFDQNCDPAQLPLLFERNVEGGIKIHVGCVRGFLENQLSAAGMSKASVQFFGLSAINHMPKCILIQKYPIQRGDQGGAGFGFYETILPGEEITWEFSAPTVNYMAPDRMKRFLERALLRPGKGRTMSPARGSQTGSAQLVEITHSLWSDEDKDLTEKEAEAKKQQSGGGGGNGADG
jgi:hypothetical protein